MRIDVAFYWISRVVPWALILWFGTAIIVAIGSTLIPQTAAVGGAILFALAWIAFGVRWLRQVLRPPA